MASEKQIDANRRNAQRSTGPKNPEGKAAVRLKALKHDLTAENAVIFIKDEEAFHELLNTFSDQLQPASAPTLRPPPKSIRLNKANPAPAAPPAPS